MKKQTQRVAGICAPSVRATPFAAALVASVIALPTGAILSLLDWFFF